MTRPPTAAAPIYGADLARVHHEAFSDSFRSAYDWLAEQIASSAARPYLFDIGCGDGGWLAHAKNMNIDGEGIDISNAFVEMARRAGVRARVDSAVSAQPPGATTAVTALGEVLAYIPSSLAPCLLTLSRKLASGGLILFDLPGPDTPQTDIDLGGKGWRLSARTRISGKRLTRRILVETREGQSREEHHQRLFTPQEACEIAQGFGLTARVLDSYGPCPLQPGRFAILARKP